MSDQTEAPPCYICGQRAYWRIVVETLREPARIGEIFACAKCSPFVESARSAGGGHA